MKIVNTDLIEPEIEVLRILNGEDIEGWVWGAAMGICCENLRKLGYAKGMYEISDKGKQLLKEIDEVN